MIFRVHDHGVASPLQTVLDDQPLLHLRAYGKGDDPCLRGIVREQLLQACRVGEPGMGIVRNRELPDPVFSRGNKTAFLFTQQHSLVMFVVGATWLAEFLMACIYLVVG